MIFERGLPEYFSLLTNFGLIPISINNEKILISSEHNQKQCKISYSSIQLIIIIILSITSYILINKLYIEDESPTILFFEIFQDISNCVFQLLLQTWVFTFGKNAFLFIRTIFVCYSKWKCKNSKNSAYKNLKILFVCIIFYNLNLFSMILVLIISGKGLTIALFVNEIARSINFTILAIILSFYTILIENICLSTKTLNFKLDNLVSQVVRLSYEGNSVSLEMFKIFKTQNIILSICSDSITEFFGMIILIISSNLLIESIHVSFFVNWALFQKSDLTILEIYVFLDLAFIILIPKWILYSRAMNCNNVIDEVSFFIIFLIIFF